MPDQAYPTHREFRAAIKQLRELDDYDAFITAYRLCKGIQNLETFKKVKQDS